LTTSTEGAEVAKGQKQNQGGSKERGDFLAYHLRIREKLSNFLRGNGMYVESDETHPAHNAWQGKKICEAKVAGDSNVGPNNGCFVGERELFDIEGTKREARIDSFLKTEGRGG